MHFQLKAAIFDFDSEPRRLVRQQQTPERHKSPVHKHDNGRRFSPGKSRGRWIVHRGAAGCICEQPIVTGDGNCR